VSENSVLPYDVSLLSTFLQFDATVERLDRKRSRCPIVDTLTALFKPIKQQERKGYNM
jgi:hypothetical protein